MRTVTGIFILLSKYIIVETCLLGFREIKIEYRSQNSEYRIKKEKILLLNFGLCVLSGFIFNEQWPFFLS
ncbi:MAG: hypothetical protein A2099_05330 [Planctomycetes bacterium GWF2_39_10]|nr:MAG: hypothetical protein A2Y09_08495 [Planctomycetes bacterium GWA2_39_15]OHB40202.1 MAG: hypothetical protein A2Y11_01260 [Planctomycetes bacterium GWC2_39_26]OHB51776.1 MAG: hypothetical protein A2099_05330 [Planctomycetes bacterium GWF2_39_10]OHC01144.1 MAG: hypothetical protein A3G70_08140 [Planctomycetes bacterium RIFCSPLOWO2_12_FULL_39_13]